MESLAYLAIVVLLFNLAPAFAPPTWTVLVFFALNSDLPPWLIVIVGAICAGTGRYNLARLSSLLGNKLKGRALLNLLVTYSFYVAGASQLKAKGIGELITEQFTSVWAILIQLLMIGAIFLLTKVNWSHLLTRQ